jgi:geranylgeranyl diphosphate synthase type I
MGGQQTASLPAAVAVELIHNASLLHDDIIDGDRMRRGRPALWAAQGVPAAILVGDALFFLAVQTLLQAGGVLQTTGAELLTATVQDLIAGEFTDSLFEQAGTVPLEASQAMVQDKTGSLIAAACRLGGLAAKADARSTDHLGAFGALMGEAFQFTDDLLGIWGDPARTGKPTGTDLRARKKSLPISFALASPSSAGREFAALYARQTPLTDDEVAHAARLVEEAGGRKWGEHRTAECTEEAIGHLKAAKPNPVLGEELAQLALLLIQRDS